MSPRLVAITGHQPATARLWIIIDSNIVCYITQYVCLSLAHKLLIVGFGLAQTTQNLCHVLDHEKVEP